MRKKFCRFLSSMSGLLFVIGWVMCAFAPLEWWQRVLLAVTLVPLVAAATIRFYGNLQLWNWGCESSKGGRER